MASVERQLEEDLALRNAAKQLLKSDVDALKTGMAQGGLGGRIASRAKDGAAEIAENTADFADQHRAQVGTGIAVAALALAGWIFRDRLSDALNSLFQAHELSDQTAEPMEQLTQDARSHQE